MPSEFTESPADAWLGSYPKTYQSRSRTWDNTPNFGAVHALTRSLPINPYVDAQRHYSQTTGREQWYRNYDNRLTTDDMRGYSSVSSLQSEYFKLEEFIAGSETSDGRLQNECLIKALTKLAEQKTNLAVTLAEAEKTSKLILDRANKIYWFLRELRHGHLGDALNQIGLLPDRKKFGRPSGALTSREAANSWLEYKYGWMPLLMDVKGSAEAIVDRLHGGRFPSVTADAKVSSEAFDSRKTGDSNFPGSYREDAVKTTKTYRVKIEADISSPHLNAAQQLGLTNPALVAWELVPYSFVFDWFVSVGDYLVAATALQGITIRRAFVSRSRVFTGTSAYFRAPFRDGTYHSDGYTTRFLGQGRDYERKPLSVDSLLLYPPVNRDPLNFQRLLSGLALLRGNARNFRV